MKKILSILALLMIVIVNAHADEEKWDSVSTAKQLYTTIKDNRSANIRLIDNIDMSQISGDEYYYINNTFRGKLSGERLSSDSTVLRSYAIYNMTKPIFSELSGAEISHVVVMQGSITGNCIGAITAIAYNSTFSDIIFSDLSFTGDSNWEDYNRLSCAVAEAEGCHFTNILVVDCNITCDGTRVGGIAGQAEGCDFNTCIINQGCEFWADGDITDGNNAYVGGIVGYASNCQINQCFNFGSIGSDDDRIGGIIGYGTNGTKIYNCKNAGVVKHCTKEGFGRLLIGNVAFKLLVTSAVAAAGAAFSYMMLYYGASSVVADASFKAGKDLFTISGFKALLTQAGDKYFGLAASSLLTTHPEGALIASQIIACSPWAVSVMASMPYVFAGVAAAALAASAAVTVYGLTVQPDEIGGIAGTLENGCTVRRCTNQGPVECSDDYCGGIVGYLNASTVESCYNRSFVKSGDTHAGGIVGFCKNGTVKNNLNVGPATANGERAGGIEGGTDGTCTRSGNYYLSDENNVYGPSTAFTQEKLPSGEIAKTMNDNLLAAGDTLLWQQELGTDFYPVINDTTRAFVTETTDNYSLVQEISNAADFYLATANPNAQISLQQDIDLDSYYFNLSTKGYPFRGKLMGNGYALTDCSYEVPTIYLNESNAALFSFAENATFENLTLSGFKLTQQTYSKGLTYQNIEALLVGQSTGCTYNNITVKNSSISRTGKSGDYLFKVGGLVAISTNDTFTNCTIEKDCYLQGYVGWYTKRQTCVGGIASYATGSTFTQCANHASIWADDDLEGGIVAYASGCTIDRCLNARGITAQEKVGGICGEGYNTVITRCVNTSWISDDDNTREDKRAGIVGYLHGSKASISQCLNFGAINYADDDCGALEGCAKDGAKGAKNTNSFYYCGYNNSCVNNQYEYSDASIFRIAKVKSGEFAYKSTIDQVEGADKWLYQDIDNNTYCTNYPVPIPAAGTVYSNILCDGTQSYSNNYSSTAAHTGVDDGYGMCSICGNILKNNVPASITISDVAGLMKVSKAVERGVDYSNTTITLTNDIDLSGYSFSPIGLDSSKPFKGTFDGQGHRIKNMNLSYAQGGVGFFGTVQGENTVIKNLIIDSSCSVTSTSGGGVAGLIGDVTSTSGSKCNLTIENCGNEADITGVENVAGLLGGVYGNNATVVNINNCYNSGAISGNTGKCSASIVGYARLHTSIRNTWNCGSVGGTQSYYTFAGTWETTSGRGKFDGTIENCYTTNTIETSKSGVTKISSDDVKYGSLCNKLNENRGTYSSWAQNLESNEHPIFGDFFETFSRSSADQWTTVVLPFDVSIDNSDPYVFYSISAVSDTTLVLSRMSGTLSAGTPAIVYMDETAKDSTNNYVLSLTANNTAYSTTINSTTIDGLTFTGVYEKKDITNENGYKLEGEHFYNLAANDSVKTIYCEPYTAYLAGKVNGDAVKLSILSNIITISDSTELIAFSNAVNSGSNYNNSIIILNNDIDMSGCQFTPIGNDTHPFKGTFNGNCHRIKNLTINGIVARTGFFGTVAGASTFIKNLIIDSSCSVTSSACGTAGVIGGLQSSYNTTCNVSIMNCGNEANITGVGNVAGVLGGVYANDATVLTINNCYNTGAITGTKESATICGYARKNFTILNSYNTGSLTGAESGKAFYRYANNGSQYVYNCYDINGAQGDGVAQLSSDDAALGVLCQNLNAGNSSSSSSAKAKTARKKVTTNAFGEVELGNSVWAQNIATDSIPTFGEDGLTYTRKSAFRYGAIVLPFDITIDDSNPYEFYTLSIVSSGDTIVVRKIIEGVLAAGTPAFLVMKDKAKNAETGNFEMSVSPAPNANMTTTVDNSLSVGGLTLNGVFHATDVTNEIGYVAYSDSIVNISALAEKVGNIICPAFNAYISGSLSINPLSLTVLFDVGDDPNAINAITNSLGESEKQVFDLGGRKTAGLQRGINIVKYGNGVARKVIIR